MKITPINLWRMINEIHVQFHESVKLLLEKYGPEALGVMQLCLLYLQALGNELEALLLISKSETTKQISEQDRVRDLIFRGFSDTVKGFRNHFNDEYREAANRLWSIFSHYGNIAKKTFDAQTAATNDLLRELDKPQMQAALEKLEITEWRDKLDDENQKFNQLMMQRYSEPLEKTTFRMRTARTETDKFYRAIVAQLNNAVLTNANDANMNEFLTELNAVIKRYKDILAQQFGKKNKTGESEN